MKRKYLEHKNNAEKWCNKYNEQAVHTMVHIKQVESCASSKHMYTGSDATSMNLYLKQTSVYARRSNKYEQMQWTSHAVKNEHNYKERRQMQRAQMTAKEAQKCETSWWKTKHKRYARTIRKRGCASIEKTNEIPQTEHLPEWHGRWSNGHGRRNQSQLTTTPGMNRKVEGVQKNNWGQQVQGWPEQLHQTYDKQDAEATEKRVTIAA